MQALVYTDTQTLVYREEKNPTEKPGESILKIQASGICGSDMHAYHGHDERRIPPLILGHEVSGVIQNGKFKDKTVVLNPLITCGNCEYLGVTTPGAESTNVEWSSNPILVRVIQYIGWFDRGLGIFTDYYNY